MRPKSKEQLIEEAINLKLRPYNCDNEQQYLIMKTIGIIMLDVLNIEELKFYINELKAGRIPTYKHKANNN